MVESSPLKGNESLKSKKWAVIISGFFVVISFLTYFFLQFRLYQGLYGMIPESVKNKEILGQLRQFSMTISAGIFTSSFVTLGLSLKEYADMREEMLVEMFNASRRITRPLSLIKYFIPDIDKTLMKDLFYELDRNTQKDNINKEMRAALLEHYVLDEAERIYELQKYEFDVSAKNAVLEYIWEHTDEQVKNDNNTDERKIGYLEIKYQNLMERSNKRLTEVVKSYMRFKDIDCDDINSAYGRLNFLLPSGNKNIRRHIYEKLYKPEYKIVVSILEKLEKFGRFLDGDFTDRAVIISDLYELQDILVKERKDRYIKKYLFDVEYEEVQVLQYAYGSKNTTSFPEEDDIEYFIQFTQEFQKEQLEKIILKEKMCQK